MTLPDGASPSQVPTRPASRAPSLTLRAPSRAQERQALAEELLLRAVHAEPSVMVAPPSIARPTRHRAPPPLAL